MCFRDILSVDVMTVQNPEGHHFLTTSDVCCHGDDHQFRLDVSPNLIFALSGYLSLPETKVILHHRALIIDQKRLSDVYPTIVKKSH